MHYQYAKPYLKKIEKFILNHFILIVSVCECMHIHAHVLLCMTATATESRSEYYIPQRLNYRQLSWCGARNRIPVLWKRRDSESLSISLANSCILKVEKKQHISIFLSNWILRLVYGILWVIIFLLYLQT